MADISIDISESTPVDIAIVDGPSIEIEMVGQGPKGDTGATGATGATGPKGDPGEGDMNASTYDPQNIEGDAFNTDNHTDGTTNKVFTATEKIKLAGIAANSTANDTDANLKNRANHTGTQAISTVTGLQDALDGKSSTSHNHNLNDLAEKSYNSLTDKPTIPTVSDAAYDATSWNSNTDVPTKNAIRDKIESMGGGGASAWGDLTGTLSDQTDLQAALDSKLDSLPYVLVASSDASQEVKDSSDYVCDGTDDQVQIQAAIDSLSTTGGIVILSAGNFSVSAGISHAYHSIKISGQGEGVTIVTSTAASFDIFTIGNRQSDSVMRNFNSLENMTVTHAGGASTNACVKVDGGGRGGYLKNVQTNEGGVGLHLMDLDRYSIINCDVNNVRDTALLLEVGAEGTYGKVAIEDSSFNMSDEDSICVRFDTTGSTNPFDVVKFKRCLFFATDNVAGIIGAQFNLGGVNILFESCQFESPSASHVEINDETWATFMDCSFIQNGTNPTTNGFRLVNDNHKLTIISCVFQKMTNVFNGVSGYTTIDFLGLTKNNGNITNIFTGQFGIRHGTDTGFAGNGALYLGTDNERYENVFTNALRINGQSPADGKVWTATDSDGNGQWETPASGGDLPYLLVASSTAPDFVKDVADYICDGVDDQVQINTAISLNKYVRLSSGTFNLSGSIEVEDGTYLLGEGMNSTVLSVGNSMDTHAITNNTDAHVYFGKIEGIKIQGNKANNTSGSGIYAKHFHSWIIKDVHVNESADNGIKFEGDATYFSINNWLINSRIENTNNQCIFIAGYAPNMHIKDNIIGGCDNFYAIEVANTEAIIVGNHIHGGASDGVYISSDEGLFVGNIVESNGRHGVNLEGNYWAITGNKFRNNGMTSTGSGLRVNGDSNSITGNQSIDLQETATQQWGIIITSSANDTSVTGNNYHGNTDGDLSDSGVDTLISAILSDNDKGFINHGSTAGTARPSGFASVEWYGSVEPTNAIEGDTWINTA